MKKIIAYSFCLLSLALLGGCKKDNYPGGSIGPIIALYDVRNIYKGQDVTLTRENMFGSGKISGLVVSDHSGGNMPAGLLVVQDRRRLSLLRGISIPLGAKAATYMPGDSVIINVEGGVLKKVGGILQITGLPDSAVTKVSSGNALPVNRVPANLILANPDAYESTLAVVVKGGFDPLPAPTEVFAGNKVLNDGFGDLQLHTEAGAPFASQPLPVSANFYGIVFNTATADGQAKPELRMRTGADVVVLSSTIEIAPVLVTGYVSDPRNETNESEANYEYIQLLATRDIDFAATPFSVVTTNNAGASTPTGNPTKGWATGGLRTYKLNLTSGFAAKGTYFYVGGTAMGINGPGSTNISHLNWVKSYNYSTADGEGFGTKTGNLLANSGNASGIAVFEGTNVTADSKPVDVIFVATGGTLYTAGPPALGYRVTNTDFYDVKNPLTLEEQPFYRSGSNTLAFAYATGNAGYFHKLGGVYNPALGKWIKARTQINVLLTKTSAVTEIEGEGATSLK